MDRIAIILFAITIFASLPSTFSNADTPEMAAILAAFQERANATNYIRYRAEGSGTVPANSHAGLDPATFAPTGKFYPETKLQFQWVSAATMDINKDRGVYEDELNVFHVNDCIFRPFHERSFIEGRKADVEFLLPPTPPKATDRPTPPIRYELNQERNFRGAGPYYVPEAILAAYGYITNEQGKFHSIADPAWPLTFNLTLMPSEDSDVVSLKYADESIPGLAMIYIWKCEANYPHRLLEIQRGTLLSVLEKVQINYRITNAGIASIRVESADASTNTTVFRGEATFTDFEASDSVQSFSSSAEPEDGSWVRDFPTGRVYQFQASKRWSSNRLLILGLSFVGMFIAVYLSRRSRSSRAARNTTR